MSTQNLKQKVLHSLADETLVDLETTFQDAHIQKVLDQLDSELVGLKSVKIRVKEIATLLLVDRARQTFGLTCVDSSLHMWFAGNPGTGAIAVAAQMAEIPSSSRISPPSQCAERTQCPRASSKADRPTVCLLGVGRV